MCGIFGFITKGGRGPDLAILRRVAAQTETRGRHAFGLAWLGPEGTIHTFKRPGPATANLGDLAACRGATVVVGHCRWATHGDPGDNRNNHPHRAGRGWLVHNGIVGNHAALVRRYGLRTTSHCDSEVLGLLIRRSSGSIAQRAARAAELVDGTMAVLGVWRRPARLLVVRRGRPLSFGQTRHGIYFASLPEGLPGRVLPIADCYAGLLRLEGTGLVHQVYTIRA